MLQWCLTFSFLWELAALCFEMSQPVRNENTFAGFVTNTNESSSISVSQRVLICLCCCFTKEPSGKEQTQISLRDCWELVQIDKKETVQYCAIGKCRKAALASWGRIYRAWRNLNVWCYESGQRFGDHISSLPSSLVRIHETDWWNVNLFVGGWW